MNNLINETAARRAKEANSFSDYRQGSATSEYQQMVNEATEIAERQKRRVDPMHHEKIDRLLATYCRKLAANMNKGFEIDARVPSIMIAGPSNFPTRKKEKQNAARDKNMEEWKYIQGLLDKIRGVGTAGISTDDPDAVDKLKSKLQILEDSQEYMKEVNAYYRKNKTLDGCPGLSEDFAQKLTDDIEKFHKGQPYPSWALSNNNANIRRIRQRIVELEKRSEAPASGGWQFDGGEVVINSEVNRLQVLFDEKPDADVRQQLKSNGFRWAPSLGVWQRLLNDNAIRAAKRLMAITTIGGE